MTEEALSFGSWNYRVVRTREDDGAETYAVHEVYYDDEGNINGYTENPVHAEGDTLQELRDDLARMLDDTHRPALDAEDLER